MKSDSIKLFFLLILLSSLGFSRDVNINQGKEDVNIVNNGTMNITINKYIIKEEKPKYKHNPYVMHDLNNVIDDTSNKRAVEHAFPYIISIFISLFCLFILPLILSYIFKERKKKRRKV